jgi:hypothetical protein
MPTVKRSFRLGEEWPDWWADLVTRNIAATYNDDGRWRGGPDRARIAQGNGFVWANKGDLICDMGRGEIEVIRSIEVDLSAGAEQDGE